MTDSKPSRAEYMRAYYQANKERLAAAQRARRSDCRDKKRVLREIKEMPRGPAVWGDEC